jgi:hypothetical protein
METCDDCGEQVYGGYCVNCHEDVFIAEQYVNDGEAVPQLLLNIIAEFEPKD